MLSNPAFGVLDASDRRDHFEVADDARPLKTTKKVLASPHGSNEIDQCRLHSQAAARAHVAVLGAQVCDLETCAQVLVQVPPDVSPDHEVSGSEGAG